jgi:hypothetical protein
MCFSLLLTDKVIPLLLRYRLGLPLQSSMAYASDHTTFLPLAGLRFTCFGAHNELLELRCQLTKGSRQVNQWATT